MKHDTTGWDPADAHQTSRADEIAAELVAMAASQCLFDFTTMVGKVDTLQQEAAGIRLGPTAVNASRRLVHPELKTTYPEVCVRALMAKIAETRRKLAAILPEATSLSMQILAAERDLRDFRYLQLEAEKKKPTRKELGLYPAAATAVDRLFDDHGITHHHWRAAARVQLERIAAILREPHVNEDAA